MAEDVAASSEVTQGDDGDGPNEQTAECDAIDLEDGELSDEDTNDPQPNDGGSASAVPSSSSDHCNIAQASAESTNSDHKQRSKRKSSDSSDESSAKLQKTEEKVKDNDSSDSSSSSEEDKSEKKRKRKEEKRKKKEKKREKRKREKLREKEERKKRKHYHDDGYERGYERGYDPYDQPYNDYYDSVRVQSQRQKRGGGYGDSRAAHYNHYNQSPPPGPYDSPPPDESSEDEFSETLYNMVDSDLPDPNVSMSEKEARFRKSQSRMPGPASVKLQKLMKKQQRRWRDRPPPRGSSRRGGGRDDELKQKCKFYAEGKCQKGDRCQYSHNFIPAKKMEACKFFLQGYCAKGDMCIYLHSEVPCKYYHTGQKCFNADKCKFSHDPLTDSTRPLLEKAILLEETGTFKPEKPSLLGSPPKESVTSRFDDAFNARSPERKEDASKKAIPSIFDLQLKPTADLQEKLDAGLYDEITAPLSDDDVDESFNSPSKRPSSFYSDTLSTPNKPAGKIYNSTELAGKELSGHSRKKRWGPDLPISKADTDSSFASGDSVKVEPIKKTPLLPLPTPATPFTPPSVNQQPPTSSASSESISVQTTQQAAANLSKILSVLRSSGAPSSTNRTADPRAPAADPRTSIAANPRVSAAADPRVSAAADPRASAAADPRMSVAVDPRVSAAVDPRASAVDPRVSTADPRVRAVDPRGQTAKNRSAVNDPRLSDPRSAGTTKTPLLPDPRILESEQGDSPIAATLSDPRRAGAPLLGTNNVRDHSINRPAPVINGRPSKPMEYLLKPVTITIKATYLPSGTSDNPDMLKDPRIRKKMEDAKQDQLTAPPSLPDITAELHRMQNAMSNQKPDHTKPLNRLSSMDTEPRTASNLGQGDYSAVYGSMGDIGKHNPARATLSRIQASLSAQRSRQADRETEDEEDDNSLTIDMPDDESKKPDHAVNGVEAACS